MSTTNMTKILIDEAVVKQALEALEYIHEGANNQGPHTGISWRCVSNKAEPAITALRKALAQQALDKMAENARDLGLDYEPAQQEPVGKVNELFDESVIEHCGFDRELLVYTTPTASTAHMDWTDPRRTHGNYDGHDDNIKPNGGSRSQIT